MKKILFVVMALSVAAITNGQKTISKSEVKELGKNIQDVWTHDEPAFSVNKVPDKWKGQSGVIIAKKKALLFNRPHNHGGLKAYETTHYKIWLNDKDAVENYSQLYFSTCRDYNGFAVQIIKPGGKKEPIDLSAAVVVENSGDVPDFFKAYIEDDGSADQRTFAKATVYYKLAVPDLQPGDILEYASFVYQPYIVSDEATYEMDPIYYLCNREYPLMYQLFEIKTSARTFINLKSLNGAPAFKETDDDDWNIYRMEDRDRDKVKDVEWVNDYLERPMIKFQIIYSHKESQDLFIDRKKDMQESIDPEALAFKLRRIYNQMYGEVFNIYSTANYPLFDHIQSQMKDEAGKAYRSSMSDDDYIRKTYYLLRHEIGFDARIKSYYFAMAFIRNMQAKHIDAELVVTVPNNVTRLKDLLFKDELIWLVRVKGKYVYSFNPYSNIDDVNPICEGNEAYVIKLDKVKQDFRKGRDLEAPEKVTLPMSDYKDNQEVHVMEASLDDNLENLSVHAGSIYKGISKYSAYSVALAYTEAFREDYKTFGGHDSLDDVKRQRDREAMEDRIAAEKELNKRKKPELMKKQLSGQFSNVVSYDEFKLVSDGRSFDKPALKYEEKYVLGGLVKRAGKNLLISLPALMGGQMQVKGEQRERQYNIYVGYPHTLEWKLIFDIPAGYTVSNADDLNASIDNATGSFTVTSKIENNKLLLDVTKIYKSRDVKKEEWSKMLTFLDPAYDFSQKKIVLKKN